jgi:ABC-2 type transport system ATP-binding protein
MNPSTSPDVLRPEVLLRAEGLHKRYGQRRVLRGASLAVPPGQLAAIVGANGEGKSTLLRILAGAEAADQGSVTRAGRLGYCPQDSLLYGSLTPDEHFELFGAAYRLSPEALRASADGLSARFALGPYRRTPVDALSGGTRQKVNLALALLHDPEVLLLDEPYAGLDRDSYRHFVEWALEARGRGRAVVLITHLVLEQAQFDVVWHLHEGRLEVAHA